MHPHSFHKILNTICSRVSVWFRIIDSILDGINVENGSQNKGSTFLRLNMQSCRVVLSLSPHAVMQSRALPLTAFSLNFCYETASKGNWIINTVNIFSPIGNRGSLRKSYLVPNNPFAFFSHWFFSVNLFFHVRVRPPDKKMVLKKSITGETIEGP